MHKRWHLPAFSKAVPGSWVRAVWEEHVGPSDSVQLGDLKAREFLEPVS